MKVTENEEKYRQFREGSHERRISAEQKRESQSYTQKKITENNNTNMKIQTDNLLEKMIHRNNMNQAYKRVKSNKGARS